jgi:hypothetical protein
LTRASLVRTIFDDSSRAFLPHRSRSVTFSPKNITAASINLCVPSGERVRPQLGFVLFLDGAIEDFLDH